MVRDTSVVPPAGTHPGRQPHAALIEALAGLAPAQWAAHCTRLARARGLASAGGAPLGFVVDGGPSQGALDYEAAIFHDGRIACRGDGPGALHDLHNAACWLAYPLTKATLNRLHLQRAGRDAGHDGRRGPARDRLTLLDESGLAWLSDAPDLDERLRAADWHGLFVAGRERLRARVLPVVIGHGLLQKLAAPYKSLTAHCLPCGPWLDAVPAGALSGPPHPDRLAAIDARIAQAVDRAFADDGLPDLAPLPVQGLPGWDGANRDPSYYDDPRVFRRKRADRSPDS